MLLFLFGKGEWRNRNEKSVKIRNEEIGKIEERRNQEDKRVSYAFSYLTITPAVCCGGGAGVHAGLVMATFCSKKVDSVLVV